MNLEIYLSNRCNFGCHYCCVTVNEGPAVRIDAARVKKAVDHFFALPAPESFPERQVYFLGGEPLLDYPVLREAIEYIRSRDKTVGVRVYTNGSLLTPPIAAFLRAHAVQIWISLDGAPAANDRHRTFFGRAGGSTFRAVGERIRQVGTESLAVNMVVHPDTASGLAANAAFFAGLGISRINIQPELYSTWSRQQLRDLTLSLANFHRYYTGFLRREGRLPFVLPILYFVVGSLSRLGEEITPWWHQCENITLGADGHFYACERLLASQYKDLKEFVIGDTETGLDLAKKERWMEQARRYLYARGERSREHYHCPKGDYLYSTMSGAGPGALLDNAHRVARAFSRAFLRLARDLEGEPLFRSVYLEKRQGGPADQARPERLLYAGPVA